MKILLVGCGLQAYGAALDLVTFAKPKELILADYSLEAANKLKTWLKYENARTLQIDAGNVDEVAKVATGCNLLLNAAPYKYALTLTQAAIKAKVSLVDLGGDTDMVLKQLELDKDAKAAGVTIVPDCGMGPGMTNIVVGHAMELLDEADTVEVRDGGIPATPIPPLAYKLVFAIETLTNEYTGKTTAIRNGEIVEVDSLTEVEHIELPYVGKVEATHGMGMLSTLPWTYKGRVKNMDNKFVRYPGHLTFIDTLRKVGFFSREAVKTETGATITPREVTKAILEKHLTQPEVKDVSVIQSTVRGRKGNDRYEIKHLIVDFSDDKLTSMARTTGFTASIVGQMIMDGRLSEKGVLTTELGVPKMPFFEDIQKRGIKFEWSQKKI